MTVAESADPAASTSSAGGPLSPSGVLADRFDVALLDLDGVVYRGAEAVPHAAAAIAEAGRHGMRSVYVTNNALRPPEDVADRLTGLGVPARPDEVVTSAQAAARMLAERLGPAATVLVTGGEGLRRAVAAEGLEPVTSAEETPAAVVVGYDPEITYARLAEATVAIRAGAWWVASNTDLTVPTERGLLPGNGAAVAFLRAATGAEPEVAGKPERAMHAESVRRSGARRPLIVGDRLDTDIEAGFRADTPTLLVLTGVTTLDDLLAAPARHRPTYLAADVRGLLQPHPAAVLAKRPDDGAGTVVAVCGGWAAEVVGGTLSWHQVEAADGGVPDDGLNAARAACAAVWNVVDEGGAAPTRGPLPTCPD